MRSPSSPECGPSSPLETDETTVAIFDLAGHEFSRTATAPASFERTMQPQLQRVPSLSGKLRQEEDEKIIELVSRLVEAKGGSGMWVSEIVTEAEGFMGSEFQAYLEHRSSAVSMHDIAMKQAQETIGFLVKSHRTMGGTKGPQGTQEDPPGSKEADVISDRQEARDRSWGSRPIALEREDDEGNDDGESEEGGAAAPIRNLVRGGRGSSKATGQRVSGSNPGEGVSGPGLLGVMEMAMQKRRGSQDGGAGLGLRTVSRGEARAHRRASQVLGFPSQLRGRRSSFVPFPETPGRAESAAGRARRADSASSAVSREPSEGSGACAWTDEEIEREKEAKEAKLTEWLCSWPKLFQIVWNSYVFRGHGASLHRSIAVGAYGRAAVKTARTDRSPTSVLLFPPIRAGLVTEVEFLVEKMAHVPHDALRVGVCTGRHRIRAGESAGSSDGGWVFGCGTGMKFHNRETHSYTKQHVKQGDKVGVVMDRPHGQVSIKINGVKQGTMFGNLPMRQDLYFVVDLVCVGEAVAMTDVAVRQSWSKGMKTIPIDPLHFRCS